jgi:hypothetical protein
MCLVAVASIFFGLLAAPRARGDDVQNDPAALFRKYDYDASGAIDRDELTDLLAVNKESEVTRLKLARNGVARSFGL